MLCTQWPPVYRDVLSWSIVSASSAQWRWVKWLTSAMFDEQFNVHDSLLLVPVIKLTSWLLINFQCSVCVCVCMHVHACVWLYTSMYVCVSLQAKWTAAVWACFLSFCLPSVSGPAVCCLHGRCLNIKHYYCISPVFLKAKSIDALCALMQVARLFYLQDVVWSI